MEGFPSIHYSRAKFRVYILAQRSRTTVYYSTSNINEPRTTFDVSVPPSTHTSRPYMADRYAVPSADRVTAATVSYPASARYGAQHLAVAPAPAPAPPPCRAADRELIAHTLPSSPAGHLRLNRTLF
eukprot:6211187-Pleurochrysis_carterae.AAC.2